jgi:hypothetical protein
VENVIHADKIGNSNSSEPDWNGDDPRIIVRDQAATAVFLDQHGELVIWQRDTLGAEGRVFLTPDNAQLVAKAILEAVESQLALPAPKKLRLMDGGAS